MSETATKSEKSKVESIIDDYNNDLGNMELTHTSFDEKEKILMSVPIDQITNKETRSKITDPTLLSAVLKQNNSVMAQMPSGKTVALTKENKGKSLFMDILLREHVVPNAISQYDVYTKLWLLSLYRKIYGSFGVLVDFVQNKGYIGPDFTLLPARAIIPQSGKTTVEDSDHTWVRSKVSKSWLESRSKGAWKNIDKILETKGDAGGVNSQSFVERQHEGVHVTKNEYELITKYEGDRWRTFHAGTKVEIRDIANPQKNDKIPVIMCHSYPLMDRFFGLGDFERGSSLHAAMGSLINLYFDGVKMSIFPPFKVDPVAIENWDDLKDGIGPGQIWLMKQNNFQGVDQMRVSPSGIESFQSTYQFLKGAILTLTNTSDPMHSQGTDPAFGKTPQALKMRMFSEGMQTQFDRRMLELSVEKIFDRMIDILSKKQEKEMPLYLKEADLRRVAEVNPDVVEMFEVGGMGKVVLKPQDIANCEYRYEIDQGSTVKKDEIVENQSLTEILGFVLKIPGAIEALGRGEMIPLGDKKLSPGELVKRWIISSGVTDWDKIIVDNTEGEGEEGAQVEENALNLENPNMMDAVSQAFSGAQEQPEGQMSVEEPAGAIPSAFKDPKTAAIFSELENLAKGGVVNGQ